MTVCQLLSSTDPATALPDLVPVPPVVVAYTSASGQYISGLVPSGGSVLFS